MTPPTPQNPITVFLADDHLLFRQSVSVMLDQTDSIKVVGSSDNGMDSVALIANAHPQVAIVDFSMQGMDGLEATRRIRATTSQTEILILTMHNNPNYVYQAFQSGCRGYLLKTDSTDELKEAVRTVARKETYISPEIKLDFIETMLSKISMDNGSQSILTSREKEICDQVVQGRSTKEIASALFISSKTVRVHIANSMRKLSCQTRTELVLRLLEMKENT